MSHEPETSQDETDLSERAETSFDPQDPIEITAANGENANPGTSPPPNQQLSEGSEDPSPTTGA